MDNLPVNIVGLGLILAGILFMYFLNFVGIIIGLIHDHRRDHGALDDLPAQEVHADDAVTGPPRRGRSRAIGRVHRLRS